MTQRPQDNWQLFAALGIFAFATGIAIIPLVLAPFSGLFEAFLGFIGGLFLAGGLELIIHKGK